MISLWLSKRTDHRSQGNRTSPFLKISLITCNRYHTNNTRWSVNPLWYADNLLKHTHTHTPHTCKPPQCWSCMIILIMSDWMSHENLNPSPRSELKSVCYCHLCLTCTMIFVHINPLQPVSQKEAWAQPVIHRLHGTPSQQVLYGCMMLQPCKFSYWGTRRRSF